MSDINPRRRPSADSRREYEPTRDDDDHKGSREAISASHSSAVSVK
jgi:hypothetical protein